jgi:hypothetical protein
VRYRATITYGACALLTRPPSGPAELSAYAAGEVISRGGRDLLTVESRLSSHSSQKSANDRLSSTCPGGRFPGMQLLGMQLLMQLLKLARPDTAQDPANSTSPSVIACRPSGILRGLRLSGAGTASPSRNVNSHLLTPQGIHGGSGSSTTGAGLDGLMPVWTRITNLQGGGAMRRATVAVAVRRSEAGSPAIRSGQYRWRE